MSQTALATVLERAEAERDLARTALQRAEESARRAQSQADQLRQYRGEYQQRWTTQFSRQGAAEIVHCYQNFMGRLEDAVTQQHQQATAAHSHLDTLRSRLVAAELRVASVKKLIERRAAEARRVLAQREQRHTDETAQQLHWRARAHGA